MGPIFLGGGVSTGVKYYVWLRDISQYFQEVLWEENWCSEMDQVAYCTIFAHHVGA